MEAKQHAVLQQWETLGRTQVLDRKPWLSLEDHKVKLHTGQVIPDWLWVDTPDFVNVAAVTKKVPVYCCCVAVVLYTVGISPQRKPCECRCLQKARQVMNGWPAVQAPHAR